MKISNYVVDIELDEMRRMLYSMNSRKYYIYNKNEKEKIDCLIKDINKGIYTKKEIEEIKKLVECKILLPDGYDEIAELEYKENKVRYQDNTFQIVIIVTNACNFRCEYCIQEHEVKILTLDSEKKILAFLKKVTKKVNKIKISWFGGEPLLQFEMIKRMMYEIQTYGIENSCEIVSTITTNGYLLSKTIVEDIKNMKISSLQITLDGDKKSHDARRYLIGKKGTYDVIKKNMICALEKGISVVLRINIDEKNADTAKEILEEIPECYRRLVTVCVSNLYQAHSFVSTFDIYKNAIEMGYQYAERKNRLTLCHACMKNGFAIDTDANIIICANANEDRILGVIDNSGDICLNNINTYYRLKTVSAIHNETCRNCAKLPLCIGTCKYARYRENKKCLGEYLADGMRIEEKAKLDYFYDLHSTKAEE